MKAMRFSVWLAVCLVVLIPLSILAQETPVGEPDTEAFIDATFQLQDQYTRVLCVTNDEPCPSEVTTRVPCLTSACIHEPVAYAVEATFETIQAAVDSATFGDLVIIMPGRYRGIEVEFSGGESGAYIHLLGWGDPGAVIVDAPARPDVAYLRHHFYFIASHHYFIQNIAFENAERGAGLFISGDFGATGEFSHHFIISDVYSHDNGMWGLHTTSTNAVLLQDSIFTTAQAEHGAYLSGSGDQMVVRRNVFQDNNAGGLQFNADPQSATAEVFYWLQNLSGDTCGWSEADVEATGAATWDDMKACYDGQSLPDLGAFFEDGVSEGLIVEQNVLVGNGTAGGAAINLASVRHSVIRNNLIYGNAAGGISCWDNAYAEDKGLDTVTFSCQDVTIVNNTIIDDSSDRGAVIITRGSRDMTVANNVIVRDRDDAYEVSEGSAQGLRSSHNYVSALMVDDLTGVVMLDADAGSGSTLGVDVATALSQFVAPGFGPWLLEDGLWPSANPDRPDYHPSADSVLATGGDPAFAPVYDVSGSPRSRTEIGTYAVGATGGVSAPTQPPEVAAMPTATVPELATIAADLFVDDDNTTGVEDGSAAFPYTTVQPAVDAAAAGATIAVAAGTYAENVVVRDKAVRLYGGFVGGSAADYTGGSGGDFSVRDGANPTRLQGDGLDSVVTLVEAGATVVDGFTVSSGSRSLDNPSVCCRGGGVYVSGGAPTLAHNIIEDNDTRTSAPPDQPMVGGGIYAENANISILDNLIRNNTSGRGGGVAVIGGSVIIRGNTVEGNVGVDDHGGGLYIAATAADIAYNRIAGNEIGRALGYGWGGGVIIFNVGTTAALSYNEITANYAPTIGSGVFIDEGAQAVMEHELVYANACTELGGVGVYVDGEGNGGAGSTLIILQSTIADHDCATAVGGNAIYVEQDSLVSVQNSILWGNGSDDVATDDTSVLNVVSTLSGEVVPGPGNLSVDPLFADAANHDYHLRSTVGRWDAAADVWVQDAEQSPAIDAGDPATPFDAEPMPNGGRVNLGAYGNTAQASQSVG